jgi:hypothetical protein
MRLWLEPAFRKLSDSGKLVVLYLLGGPSTSAMGCYRLSTASAAEDLGFSVGQFRRHFEAVLKAFSWRYEAESGLLWIPSWAEENAPANPNICRSWRSAFDELPDSPLKAEAVAATFTFLRSKGEAFAKAFGDSFVEPVHEPFGNGSANTPDPDPERANRIANDDASRLANAANTRDTVAQLQRRGWR